MRIPLHAGGIQKMLYNALCLSEILPMFICLYFELENEKVKHPHGIQDVLTSGISRCFNIWNTMKIIKIILREICTDTKFLN